MSEELKQQEEDICTCGHDPLRRPMDSSFVHLPAHQQSPDERKPRMSFATTSLDTFRHLQELMKAAQSGGDGVRLCADCIGR